MNVHVLLEKTMKENQVRVEFQKAGFYFLQISFLIRFSCYNVGVDYSTFYRLFRTKCLFCMIDVHYFLYCHRCCAIIHAPVPA